MHTMGQILRSVIYDLRLGAFAYIEASYPREPNDTARLLSKVLQGKKCMTFHYHMYSEDPSNIGTLNVYIKERSSGIMTKLFSVSGSQGNEWKKAMVNLVLKGKKKYQVCMCRAHALIFKMRRPKLYYI